MGEGRDEALDACTAPRSLGHDKRFGWLMGKLRDEKIIAAKPIESSRITMPPLATFDPVPFMDAATAHALHRADLIFPVNLRRPGL